MAVPYVLALAHARIELRAAKLDWDECDKQIEAGEKLVRHWKDRRTRAMNDHERLHRLCQSLEAAGGVE